MSVLDLGGLADAWVDMPIRPRELVLLNLPNWNGRATRRNGELTGTTVRYIAGDACDPPSSLLSEKFDLVYCNSVIEHVGGHQRRVDLSNAIHRLGRHHWVQTPYRFFPIEAHSLAPGLQFLPKRAQAAVLRRWPIGHMGRFSPDWLRTSAGIEAEPESIFGAPLRGLDPYYAMVAAQSIELLSRSELQVYFPDSDILTEVMFGFTKSLIAVR